MRNGLERYARWVEGRAAWILVGLGVGTALLALQLPRLQVRNDLQTFYPHAPLTQTYHHLQQTFGGDAFPQTVYVRFTPRAGEQITAPEAVSEMEGVLEALRAVPGVLSAAGLPDLVKLITSGLHGGDPAFARLPVEGDPLGYSFEQLIRLTTQRLSSAQDYLSPQGTALELARLDPRADLLEVAGAVEAALAPLEASARATKIELMGYGSAIREFNAATRHDLRLLVPLVAALMALVLLWTFRQPPSAWVTVGALVAVVSVWSLDGSPPPAWRWAGVSLALGLVLGALWLQLRLRGRSRAACWTATLVLLLAVVGLGASTAWPWALGGLALAVVALSFRALSAVYLPLLVVSIALIWTFGLMALSGVTLSFLMLAVLPLLLGVGLDDALHLLHRTRRERQDGSDPSTALARALKHTGGAILLTTLTTVAGFAALVMSASPPVRAFGLLATFAMLSAFGVTLLLVPAVQRLTWTPPPPARPRRRWDWERLNRVLTHPRWAAGWLAGVIALGGTAYVAGQALQVYPFDLRWMLPPRSDQVRLYDQVNREFKDYDQVQVLLEGDVARLAVMRALNQELGPALSASPYARGVRHLARLLDDVRYSNPQAEARFMDSFATDPDGAYRALLAEAAARPALEGRLRGLAHADAEGRYDATVVRVDVLRAHTPDEVTLLTRDLERRLRAVQPRLEAAGLTVSLTGSPYLESLSLTALRGGFFASMGLAFLLVGLVLSLALRSWLWGVVCLVPMALVMAFELATIQLLGLHISASTALVAALGIGLGVDYTIHLTQRVREGGSIVRGAAQVAPPLLATSATSLAAFLSLLLGQIPWNRDFGVLAGTAIVYALGVTLLVTPSLLAVLRPWLHIERGGTP